MKLTLWALALSSFALAVKPEDFKTCSQSSFCRRLKGIAKRHDDNPTTFKSPYSVDARNQNIKNANDGSEASYIFPIISSLYPDIQFQLRVDILQQGDGIVRIRMDELDSPTGLKRYNETAKWALVNPEPETSRERNMVVKKDKSTIKYGPKDAKLELEIQHSPFKITQRRGDVDMIVINERSLFHMEHYRRKSEEKSEEGMIGESEQMVLKGDGNDRAWFEEDDDEMFEEKFKQWTDSKPKGKVLLLRNRGVSL